MIAHMTRYRLHDNMPLYAFARRSILTAWGLNLGTAQLFETAFRGRLLGRASRQDVDRVMREFHEAWARGHRVRVEPWHSRISERRSRTPPAPVPGKHGVA
jgi:hypothetical protein